MELAANRKQSDLRGVTVTQNKPSLTLLNRLTVLCVLRRVVITIGFIPTIILFSGCDGGNTAVAVVPALVPSVNSISPTSVTSMAVASFTVTGRNLPLTAEMSVEDGICSTPTHRTASGFNVLCRIGTAAGSKVAKITTSRPAYGGKMIDASKTIVVNASFVGYSASATGGCVYDNSTGLMWEVKTSDGGWRDGARTYTNYKVPHTTKYGYVTQADISSENNTITFIDRVNASNLCGHNDWRLPTELELQSIVIGMTTPNIDPTWFPNMKDKFFWSSPPAISGVDPRDHAWGFDYYKDSIGANYPIYKYNSFNYAAESDYDGGHSLQVRLVREGR